jgi:hypothetical protein
MHWFQVKRGRLAYRGHLTRLPLVHWLATLEGEAALERATKASGLRFFAAARTRRRIWKTLDRAGRSDQLRTALHNEADRFAQVLGHACYAPALPRTQVALHRMVIVPRALLAARARAGVRQRLWSLPCLADLDEHVRAFLCEQVLVELDRTIERASPSISSPIEGADGWSCIGTDRPYVWIDPLWAGEEWSGHVFMFEFPRAALTSAQRKELNAAVKHLQTGLNALSRLQRDAIVRRAADGLAIGSSR